MTFTGADTPDVTGQRFLITGGNSGIGLEAARALAKRGGHVIIAGRTPAKIDAAQADVASHAPGAQVDTLRLDLSDLDSVRAAAQEAIERFSAIDVLVNNAGVMGIPRTLSAQGYELQFATNHLGHFALTGLLLDHITRRVVNVASIYHKQGTLNLEDLQGERSYKPFVAYAQSKLANVLFTFELARRLKTHRPDLLAIGCHPGYSATNLQGVGPQMEGSAFKGAVMKFFNATVAQSAAAGAWPTLLASAGDIQNGDYVGPQRLFEMRGPVGRAQVASQAKDEAAQRALWERSEELTGVSYL